METFPKEISHRAAIAAQAAPLSLFSRFPFDPKKVKRCYRAFRSTEEGFHEARERGHKIFSSGPLS